MSNEEQHYEHFLSQFNIIGSGGDILYVFLLLRHKGKLVLDDPTGLGFVLVQ